MHEILKDLDFCFAYIDDILVFSHSPQEHDQHLRTLFAQLAKFGILLNPSKCVFRVPELSFLGYRISSLGSQPLPERVTHLQACPLPRPSAKSDVSWECSISTGVSSRTQPPSKPLFTTSSPVPKSRDRNLSPGMTHNLQPSANAKPVCLKPLSWLIHTRLLYWR